MRKSVTAILVAGGSSSRMGFDKLALPMGSSTVLGKSLAAFDEHPYVDEIVLVHGKNVQLAQQEAMKCKKPVHLAAGGDTRAQSVANGMKKAKGEIVAIHDAARPFVTEQLITQVLQAAFDCGAAAPAVAVKDTIKQAQNGLVENTPSRESLWAVQTPQCFNREMYLKLLSENPDMNVTDDCQLFEQAGLPVRLTAGDYENKKLTTPDDVKGEKTMRIGHGYDVHKLVEDRKLIIGGVEIPYEKGLLGHSDADVLTHAVMDSLLGAAALGDIGKHFPDNDPAYKGADSLKLAQEVASFLKEKGYTVENIDATVLCQAPKLAPHIPQMRKNLALALGIEEDRINVKATTEEHLGFTGQGLGIAAHSVCLLNN